MELTFFRQEKSLSDAIKKMDRRVIEPLAACDTPHSRCSKKEDHFGCAGLKKICSEADLSILKLFICKALILKSFADQAHQNQILASLLISRSCFARFPPCSIKIGMLLLYC
jgi:hypothetical protein